jgi:hypothetical protein
MPFHNYRFTYTCSLPTQQHVQFQSCIGSRQKVFTTILPPKISVLYFTRTHRLTDWIGRAPTLFYNSNSKLHHLLKYCLTDGQTSRPFNFHAITIYLLDWCSKQFLAISLYSHLVSAISFHFMPISLSVHRFPEFKTSAHFVSFDKADFTRPPPL